MKHFLQLLASLMMTLVVTGGVFAANQSEDRFLDVQQITILRKGATNQIVVSDPVKIKQLVMALNLVKSDNRICDMQWQVTFVKKVGQVEAAVCQHCFEIRDEKGIERYETPREFYQLVKKIEAELPSPDR